MPDKDENEKIRVTISITRKTSERLKEYAKTHNTGVSQTITHLIWTVYPDTSVIEEEESEENKKNERSNTLQEAVQLLHRELDALEKELEEKKRQIEKKNAQLDARDRQIENMTASLLANTQVNLKLIESNSSRTVVDAPALDAGEPADETAVEAVVETVPSRKLTFLERLRVLATGRTT